MKECLSVQDGFVTKGKCIVIPKKACKSIILKGIHEAHQDIEKCLLKARKGVYWRGMCRDIENMVRTWEICRELQRKNSKETMLIKEQATRSFQKQSSRYFRIQLPTILTCRLAVQQNAIHQNNEDGDKCKLHWIFQSNLCCTWDTRTACQVLCVKWIP